MDRNSLIIVTGAAGFIGSCLVGYLNRKGFQNIIISDSFDDDAKRANYDTKHICMRIERDELFDWLSQYKMNVDVVFHLGARTDTTEFNYAVHEELNVKYSQSIWNFCVKRQVPLIYASSAATYGDGAKGYIDDHSVVPDLEPLNPYGVSKNEFDKWVLKQESRPPFWAGLKFFNVYGPNEYHKGRMASVIFHAFNQIRDTGRVKLFRSHKQDFSDGGQLRDFVYVKDVVDICLWLIQEQPDSGLYNVGTGKARSFNDLVAAIFSSLGKEPSVDYIDTPADIRDKYQYFTEADMRKLRAAGYREDFYSLEEGIDTYVTHFLSQRNYY